MCEGCGAKQANFGTPTERKKRWCGGCGKAHGAISLLVAKMCEGCGAKQASFGTPTERKKRWCGGCGKGHGAINVKASGTKRPRSDPLDNLTTSAGTMLEAGARADGTRAREGMHVASYMYGDATSLLAELAMVKQELPADGTHQYTL
jgi:ribosomal protein S27E